MKRTFTVILCVVLAVSSLCPAVFGADKKADKKTEKENKVPETYQFLIENGMISADTYAANGFWSFEHSKKEVTATFTGIDLSQKVFTYEYKDYREPDQSFFSTCVPGDAFLGCDKDGNFYFSSYVARSKSLLFGWVYLNADEALLVKFSPEGELLQSTCFDAEQFNTLTSLCILKNGNMIAVGSYITKSFNGQRKSAAALISPDGQYISRINLVQNAADTVFLPYEDGAAVITDKPGGSDGISHYNSEMTIVDERMLNGFSAELRRDNSLDSRFVFSNVDQPAGKKNAVKLYGIGLDGKTEVQKNISLGKFKDYTLMCIENSDEIMIRFIGANGETQYKIYSADFKCKGTPDLGDTEAIFALFDGKGYLIESRKKAGSDENAELKYESVYSYFDCNLKLQWQIAG